MTRRLPASTIARLETIGDVDVHLDDRSLSTDELRARVAGKDALVAMLTDEVNAAVLDAGSTLKIVANVAVGFNNIDVRHARARGIIVTNTPDVLTEATAELTWALMLAVTRRLAEGERIVRRGGWTGWAFDSLLGTSLAGKQLGIVGFGRIGRAVAAKAPAFGMRVAFASRNVSAGMSEGVPEPTLETRSDEARAMPLDRLLNNSDIVSLHVPLNDETRHLIDKRRLVRMKRSAYLINTSRGPVVDEAALAWALQERLIAGAALDVYEHEPAVHPDLLGLENVLLVPHLGSSTIETRTAMANLAADNVAAVLSGRPSLTPVAA